MHSFLSPSQTLSASLLASYVGGSINFAQTASLLKVPSAAIADYAAADIAGMGVYLGGLEALAGPNPSSKRNATSTPFSLLETIRIVTSTAFTVTFSKLISSPFKGLLSCIVEVLTLLYLPLGYRPSSATSSSLTRTAGVINTAFYCSVGLAASNITRKAMFHVSAVLAIHLGLTGITYRVLGRKEVLIASNAAVGGAGTSVAFARR